MTACGGSTLSGRGALDLSGRPKDDSCKQAVVIPDRDIARAEVEQLWGRDRARLSQCFDSFESLLAYVSTLEHKLSSVKPVNK